MLSHRLLNCCLVLKQEQKDHSWKSSMKVRSWGRMPGRPRAFLAEPICTWTVSRGSGDGGISGNALIHVGRRGRISPAALFTGHRPFWVVLTVTEVRHEVIKPNNSTTAKYSVVAGDLQLWQHVPHDPRYGAQVGNRHYAAVHRARLLLREPLGDAGIAESMLAMRCLEKE